MRIVIDIECGESTATVTRSRSTPPVEVLAAAEVLGAEDAGPAPSSLEGLSQVAPPASQLGVGPGDDQSGGAAPQA
jgi:hypothetical protein